MNNGGTVRRRPIEESIITSNAKRILLAVKAGQTVTALAYSGGFWHQHVVHGARTRYKQLEIYSANGYWLRAKHATIFPKGNVGG